jgi:group I intron endonuclease
MIIYMATNLSNNKIYVGKTIRSLKERIREHTKDSRVNKYKSALHDAINKYGEDNFRWEIIDRCLFDESLCELEKYYIKKFNSKIPNGYNMTDGGDGHSGYIAPQELRDRLSKIRKGKQCGIENPNYGNRWSNEQRDRARKFRLGKKNGPRSEETKKKISEANKKYFGPKHNWYGKKHTKETKEKMSLARKLYWNKKHDGK